MKYGLLMHLTTQNIGDDIQSFAAAQFMPSVDYLVNRETIDSFRSEGNEKVATVMGAWYMWSKWNWPPSDNIVPDFLGFHYTINHQKIDQDGSAVTDHFLQGIGGDYLKAYAPIGCRDYGTMANLEKLGIDAYFSGCLTLALPKMPMHTPEKKYICLVDIGANVEKRVREYLKDEDIEIKVITHRMDYRNSTATWEERKKAVVDLLTVYQNATCVLTRRLHAALPCLAMEVPVLLVTGNLTSERFIPYYDWLHVVTPKDFIHGDYDYSLTDPPKNAQDHLPYRNKLIEDMKEFYAQTDHGDYHKEYTGPANGDMAFLQWQNETMKRALEDELILNREDFNKIKQYKQDVNQLTKDVTKLEKEQEKQRGQAEVLRGELTQTKTQMKKQKEENDQRIREQNQKITGLEADKKEKTKKIDQLTVANSKLTKENLQHRQTLNYRSVRMALKMRKVVEKTGVIKVARKIKRAFTGKKKGNDTTKD